MNFFGKHDHAIVNSNSCFLFSEEDPNDKEAFATDVKLQKQFTASMKEVTLHIDLLRKAFGFTYAPFKVVFNPNDLENLVEAMTTSKDIVERGQENCKRTTEHETGNVPKKIKLTEKNQLKSSKNHSPNTHRDSEKLQQESKPNTEKHQSDDEEENYFDDVLIKEEDKNDVICLLDQSDLESDDPYENMLQYCDVVSVTDDKREIALLRDEVRNLRLELDQVKSDHRQEIIKLKEIQEKQKLEITRLQRKLCENCQQEAKFHCCRRTFYCNEDCQKKHWATVHRSYCERR